ncbi:MAG: SPOR domain-containing protein [Marinifilaceae bacterium]
MRSLFCSLVVATLFASCTSQYAMIDPSQIKNEPAPLQTQNETQQPKPTPVVQQTTIEIEKETPRKDEKVVIRQEEVTLTQGAEIMQYCVIVGSFINDSNAINLRASLVQKGYTDSNIMQNRQGMYRVSVACSNSESAARSLLSKIRSNYPEFKDAWLLQTK